MHAIRIVLGTLPRMLRDIVRDILEGQPDMHVVSDTRPDDEWRRVVARETPDIIVVQMNADGLAPLGDQVLWHHDRANVLGLSADGRSAAMYQLRLRRTTVLEVSPDGLLKAIRGAVDTAVP